MLITRLRTALIALPLFLGALFYLPTWAWALFLMPWLLVGAWEWGALAQWTKAARVQYLMFITALCTALWLLVIVPAQSFISMVVYVIALLFWLAAVPLWLARGWRVQQPLVLVAAGILVLLPMWLAMVQLQRMPSLLLVLIAILWVSDTAAYFCGKRWGRRKLAPAISPGKTWEGVAGALAGVTLYYAIVGLTFPTEHVMLNGLLGLAVFLALTVLGVEGDLFESWLKRTAGMKDSGTMLPGHGGILDRVDALTSTMPVAALILAWPK